MATPRVFISMGTPFTPELTAFRDALESLLRDRCGVDPRIIGKNEYPAGNPLAKIVDVLKSCNGIVVVANERKYVELGTEKRGSSQEVPLQKSRYTTPWNHIESALAYGMGVPIYVIAQSGLQREGLIEDQADWYIQDLPFEAQRLAEPQVVDSLRNWVDERVKPHAKLSPKKPTNLESFKFSEMTLNDLVVLLGLALLFMGIGGALEHFAPGVMGFFKIHPD